MFWNCWYSIISICRFIISRISGVTRGADGIEVGVTGASGDAGSASMSMTGGGIGRGGGRATGILARSLELLLDHFEVARCEDFAPVDGLLARLVRTFRLADDERVAALRADEQAVLGNRDLRRRLRGRGGGRVRRCR